MERKHNSHNFFTMVSEETQIRRFVSGQLRDCHDLSTLTVGILKGRYLACVGRESLTQEEKLLIKRVVGEELMMMQDGDEPVMNVIPKPHHNKRKREEETQEKGQETEADGFRGKRPRRQSIERHGNGEVVENDCETGSEEKEEEEKSAKKQGHETKNMKRGQESSDSDSEENEKQVREKSPGGKENVDVKNKQKTQGAKKSRKRRGSKSEEKRGEPSKGEAGRDPMQVVSIDSKSAGGNQTEEQKKRKRKQNIESDFSSEGEEEKNVKKRGSGESSEKSDEGGEEKNAKKRGSGKSSEESDAGGEEKNVKKRGSGESSEENDEEKIDKKDESAPDSDSSSLPSLEDEQESEKAQPEKVKKKTMKKGHMKGEDGEPASKGGMEKEATAVSRLKRYIALCGVRRNYKKLLGGCRSIRSSVAVLKKELEELGVEGQPSIEKCKKARLKREETQELADLDVSNIITTQGRPKRRGTSAWQQQQSPLPSYKRTVTSSSDSEDSHAGSRRKRATDWSNLQGIISDDGDSD